MRAGRHGSDLCRRGANAAAQSTVLDLHDDSMSNSLVMALIGEGLISSLHREAKHNVQTMY